MDEAGEGGVVAGGDGGGGGGEEGGDVVAAVQEGGDPQGCGGGDQRLRILGDQELEHGGVAVRVSRSMKVRPSILTGDGQQAPLPRVELGLRDHQLNEFQWRRAETGVIMAVRAYLSWKKT